MSLLCKCIRLNLITEDKTDSGGAESTWTVTDAKNATYTVELLAGAACGGVAASQESKLSLKMNGCGWLRITVSGDGSVYNTFPDALAYREAPSFVNHIQLAGEGGFTTGCGSSPLVLFDGSNPAEIRVCCGHVITLQVISLDNTQTPDLTIEFTLEVIPEPP